MLTVGAENSKPLSRSRKSAAKRDAILRAAIKIINAKSFALATMTEIAASLDLRDASLYYYFPSKHALVYACHISSLERFEKLLKVSSESSGSGAAKLRYFLHSMIDDSDRNGPQLYFGDHSYLEADQHAEITAWAARLTGLLEQFLKDGINDGSVRPCETQLVVQLLLGMLIWLAKWVPSMHGLTVDRLMTAIGAFSLDGLSTELEWKRS
ncbi:MAG: TetR/AcrR family transcriptional regulator [Pseudomonadota bacterium]|nr:TetR/AcrR family transcriptional regulator [Pseudomonadota bacterium]